MYVILVSYRIEGKVDNGDIYGSVCNQTKGLIDGIEDIGDSDGIRLKIVRKINGGTTEGKILIMCDDRRFCKHKVVRIGASMETIKEVAHCRNVNFEVKDVFKEDRY